MRPIKLVLQAFGPYKNREEVDFDKLSENGIFLIKGPTGSGKTTIFDGMTYALYGGSSGDDSKSKVGRNDLLEWRCNQADIKTDTIVEFTFSIHDNIYRFTRKLEYKRTKFAEINDISLMGEDGVFHPQEENPKASILDSRAVELIGLTKDQFRQVVLLPQGQFEKFLTASSDEKEKILSKIFNSEQWKEYAQRFFTKAAERKEKLDNIKKEMDTLLREEGFLQVEELLDAIEKCKSNMDKLEAEYLAFNSRKRQEALNKNYKLLGSFKELHSLEKERNRLLELTSDIDNKKRTLAEAEKAEELREIINETGRTKELFIKRDKEYAALLSKKDSIIQSEAEAFNQLENMKKSMKTEELINKKGRLEGKKDIYKNLDELSKKLTLAMENVDRLLLEKENHKKLLETAKKAAAVKNLEYEKAYEEAGNIRKAYFAGIYGQIARELIEGSPCPVCGSTEHPVKAEVNVNSATKEQVEQAEANADKLKKSWDTAEKKRMAQEEYYSKAEQAFNEAALAKESAEAAYNSARQNLEDGIDNYNMLVNRIKRIEMEIRKEEENLRLLEDNYNKKHDEVNTYNTRLQNALEEKDKSDELYHNNEKQLEAELVKKGYGNISEVKLLEGTLRKKLTSDISAYQSSVDNNREKLDSISKELVDIEEPEAAKLEAQQEEINTFDSNYNSNKRSLTDTINRLNCKAKDLIIKNKEYFENINQAEKDLTFAKKLRGDTGIGLQRYVLGIMFDQVVFEANNMLRKVHGGRYQLFRTDERGSGNKRGLELIAHDARKPEEKGRAVSMLSGGEKFLVSLSLSIGMSNVAQKSGLRIEALFIDEGFGTLDDSSINDAMNILDSIQKSNGMIGIISHVQILESNIPTHLEVVKTDGGSSIKRT